MIYSTGIVLVWRIASIEAIRSNALEIEPVHFLLAICKLGDARFMNTIRTILPEIGPDVRNELISDFNQVNQLFESHYFDADTFKRRVRDSMAKSKNEPNFVYLIHRSQTSRKLFERAENLSKSQQSRDNKLRPIHLLKALSEIETPPWQPYLVEANIDNLSDLFHKNPQVDGEIFIQESANPLIERYGRNLTQLARQSDLDPLIGRKNELRRIAQVLLQRRKNNVLLVGEAGVGKTCIVEGLAQALISQSGSPALEGRQIIQISMSNLVAGTKYRGEFEERFAELLNEVGKNQRIILFIDEIHTLMGAGGEGASDAAQMLKPALASNQIRCIGATTIKEYRKYIERDEALMRRFEVIWVEEPNRDEAVIILEGLRPIFEEHHGVAIESDAIQSAVDLSIQYLPDLHLPDKAIDLIDQACSRARLQSISSIGMDDQTISINRHDISIVVSNRCRIPLERLTADQSNKLLKIEEFLSKRIFGQEQAIKAVAESIRISQAGLKSPVKPIGVFLFVGPTGTGKTELAKAIAEFLFDDEHSLIRFDMSEFMEKHSVSKFIGAPPGYVGYDDEAQLTGRVRSKPYCVILFDEIEKAHPDILDVLLQVFDEGVLTDSHGRRVDFRNTLITMTSNLGNQTNRTRKQLGFIAQEGFVQQEIAKSKILEDVRLSLRPELINRITKVIYFDNLDRYSLRKIIDKYIAQLKKQLEAKNLVLQLTDSIYDELMLRGFTQEYGAREMERVVNNLIVEPLSLAILGNKYSDGMEIVIDYRGGNVVLE